MAGSAGEPGEGPVRNAILIAGPTASGKSALAMALARRTGGVIVNADSMQVYGVLDILTARPGPAERAQVPHFLYGHVDPATPYSAGRWLADVHALAVGGTFAGRRPIFVGGTGLYLTALAEGLSEMPPVPATIRRRWRQRLADHGAAALHAVLSARDPDAALRLRSNDGQRIVRALEVAEASGRSILDWQRAGSPALVDQATATRLVIDVDRDRLVARIDRRFDRMVEQGALAEVEALLSRELDPALPAMKAIGVREFQSVIAHKLTLEDGTARAKIATRQYAKRQATWFRHQMGPEWHRLAPTDGDGADERAAAQALKMMSENGDAFRA